jgi:hypothetical protein
MQGGASMERSIFLAWPPCEVVLAWLPCKVVVAWKGAYFLAWPPCEVVLAFKGRYCWLQCKVSMAISANWVALKKASTTTYGCCAD